MFEKVNCEHPDVVADRIAGALVDYAYTQEGDPRIAVEVLIGHGTCHIIAETSVVIPNDVAESAAKRISRCNNLKVIFEQYPQDSHLSDNQKDGIRCGDNGIFKGVPLTREQEVLTRIVRQMHDICPYDGKYIIDGNNLIACQSHIDTEKLKELLTYTDIPHITVNPLGDWTGGIDVDSGVTGRKLGSGMGDSVTGGSPFGKDCSKADVSVNIYCWLMAQKFQMPYEMHCAIGDTVVDGIPYEDIVKVAKDYIKSVGGFEKFAEWGLIR